MSAVKDCEMEMAVDPVGFDENMPEEPQVMRQQSSERPGWTARPSDPAQRQSGTRLQIRMMQHPQLLRLAMQ